MLNTSKILAKYKFKVLESSSDKHWHAALMWYEFWGFLEVCPCQVSWALGWQWGLPWWPCSRALSCRPVSWYWWCTGPASASPPHTPHPQWPPPPPHQHTRQYSNRKQLFWISSYINEIKLTPNMASFSSAMCRGRFSSLLTISSISIPL